MSPRRDTGPDRGPTSPGRRKLLKCGVAAAIGLAVLGFSAPITEKAVQKLLDDRLFGNASSSAAPARASLSSLGEQLSLSEATLNALFQVSVPNSLPTGTAFAEARIAPDGNMVSLLYSNASMEPLELYGDGSVMAIYQIKEDVINGPPSYLPASFDRVSVNGNPGFGRGPSGDWGSGQLQWWSSGKRISIFANLDLPGLIAIGSSMGDPQ